MQVPSRILFASAVLLLASAKPSYAAPDTPPSSCSHRDINYGHGNYICVAPGYAQVCDTNNTWKTPEKDPPYDTLCAKAVQVFDPPAQCIYHDVKYSSGSSICVGPNFPMLCTETGSWIKDVEAAKIVKDVCPHAQIPSPTYPAAPASK